MADIKAAAAVLVALLLKLCNKIVENEFASLDPRFFIFETDSEEAHGRNDTCHYDTVAQANSSHESATTWIFTVRYLLTVLGGVISSFWLGYIRVLKLGGAIMLLSTVLISAAVFNGLICHQTSPIVLAAWMLLPLFYGLTQPNIMYGIFRHHSHRRLSTVVSAAYYTVSILGVVLSVLLAQLALPSAIGSHCTLIYISFAVAFIVLTFFLPRDPHNQEPFEMPTPKRMRRYFLIFSGLILFLVNVAADTRSTMYSAGLNFYLNGTQPYVANSWLLPQHLNQLSVLASSLLLLLVGLASHRQLPVQLRIQSGILLELCVSVVLTIFTAVHTPSAGAAIFVYTAASVFDAIAEVLTMVASYDQAQQIAPRNSKTFVFGVMFAVWGLANIFSRLLLLLIQELLKSSGDLQPRFYVYHLIMLFVMLCCAAYHHLLTFPLARQLTPTEDESSNPMVEELRPLIETSVT